MVSLLRKLFKSSRFASGAHNDNPPAYDSLDEKHVPKDGTLATQNKKAAVDEHQAALDEHQTAVDDHQALSKTTTPSSEDKKPTIQNKQKLMEQLRRHVKEGKPLSEWQRSKARHLLNGCSAVAGNSVPYITELGYLSEWSMSRTAHWTLPVPPPRITPGSRETAGVGPSWSTSFQNLSVAPLRTWEIEHMIHPGRDWTLHWGWHLYIGTEPDPGSSGPDWSMSIYILFEDLPQQLKQGGVSWGGSLAEVQVGKPANNHNILPDDRRVWQQAYQFVRRTGTKPHANRDGVSAGAADISWAATVFVNHEKKAWFEDGDFRRLLKPEHIQGAELDQRTQPGRCKKVLAYRKQRAYGNDLMGDKIEVWSPKSLERLTEFLETLLPRYEHKLI